MREPVQGGLVGPVHVLDDQHGGLGAQRLDHRPVAALRGRGPVEQRRDPAAEPVRDVVQRAEGAGGEQVVAGPRQHPHLAGRRRDERLDQAGLPDARLSGDGRNPAHPTERGVEGRTQRSQRRTAFQQLHTSMLRLKGGLPG